MRSQDKEFNKRFDKQEKLIEKLANENIFSAGGSNNFKFSEFKHASVKIVNPITARGDGFSA